jgi:hypothetical protein
MAQVQIETADDHAICHKSWQQAVEFYGLRHSQVSDRQVYLQQFALSRSG